MARFEVVPPRLKWSYNHNSPSLLVGVDGSVDGWRALPAGNGARRFNIIEKLTVAGNWSLAALRLYLELVVVCIHVV